MKKRDAKAVVPLAITATALLSIPGALASAAGSRAGGKVHIYEADTALAGNRGTVILSGALTDHGADHQGVAGGGTINKLVLSKGSFEVSLSMLGPKLVTPVDPKTCSSVGSATAPVPIIKGTGTGAYRGISGTFRVSATVASIAPRRKNGTCNAAATRYPGVLLVQGAGRVSYK